jgi:hypothetical protein
MPPPARAYALWSASDRVDSTDVALSWGVGGVPIRITARDAAGKDDPGSGVAATVTGKALASEATEGAGGGARTQRRAASPSEVVTVNGI